MRCRTLTVRARATVLATLLCAAVLAVAGVLVVQTLDRHLTDSSDELSRSRSRDLLDQAGAGELPPVLRNVNDDGVAQVIAADGTVLAASANIEGKARIVDPGGRAKVSGAPSAPRTTRRPRPTGSGSSTARRPTAR